MTSGMDQLAENYNSNFLGVMASSSTTNFSDHQRPLHHHHIHQLPIIPTLDNIDQINFYPSTNTHTPSFNYYEPIPIISSNFFPSSGNSSHDQQYHNMRTVAVPTEAESLINSNPLFYDYTTTPGLIHEEGNKANRNNYSHGGGKKRKRNNEREEEKPREVVHVRAKRGQATDSHSLAERLRREKINEKLRSLQDLVPGCYKAMGMAVMLDVIINYVRSLQNQIEFLSMKLSAASLFYDFNSSEMDALETMQGTNGHEVMERMVGEDQYGGGLPQFQSWPL